MPIAYQIDRSRRQVSTFVTGPVTVDEIMGHFEAVQREEVLSYVEFIDAREVGPPTLSGEDIWHAARLVLDAKLQRAFGRRAVVVGTEKNFGLARLFTLLLTGYLPMEVFRDEAKAKAWLDDGILTEN